MHNLQVTVFKLLRIQLAKFRFFYSLIFLVCFNVSVWAEPPLRTINADSNSLIVEFKLPELRFSDENRGEEAYSQLSFRGAQHTLEVGYPQLPIYSQLIGIPVSELPQATIINSKSDIRPTKRILPVQPDFFRRSESSLVEQPVRNESNADVYRQNRFYPTHVVEIVPVGFIRDQRVAQLKIHPVQYNPRLSKLKVFQELQIRINFNQPASSVSQVFATYQPSRPFEALFRTQLFNYDQAKAWRSVQLSQAQHTSAPAQEDMVQKYTISVTRTGMYRITHNRLQRAGVDTSNIDLETIKMENDGRLVGVHVLDDAEDGKFDRDASIVFYGQKLVGNKFTDTNVYWLSWNSPESSRVEVRDAQPDRRGKRSPVAFLMTERFEKDYLHDSLEADDVRSEFADHYFWTSFKAGDNKPFSIDVPYAVPRDVINRPATIRMKLQGASLFNHRARLLLNNKWIGRTQQWRRQTNILTTHDFQQRQLLFHDYRNHLTVIAEVNTRLSSDATDFYVDWFELDYWHTFNASSGALEFNSTTEPESVGMMRYRVEDLRSSEIDVYKILNGSIVAKLVNGNIYGRSNSNFQITFQDDVTEPSNYFVLDNRAYRNVSKLVAAKPETLIDPANQADYIVISHKDFINSIKPLVEFRRSQGLSVIVVDIEDVYEQFNNGVFSPFAIQNFLRYAYTSWRQPAPSYVLLVGDAHYDYKRATVELYRVDGRTYNLYPNFVPTIHGWAPVSGETAMDHRFVAVSGDDSLPDMFIGRLSVQNARELDTMVRKLIDYERNPKRGVWQRTLVQVSDDEKSNSIDWIFEESRDRLIEEIIPIAYDTRKIYLRRIVSPDRTRGLILKSIDEGCIILEYAGHGGSATWADEGIFRIENIARLRNQYLPFVITTTCLNGQFDKPLQFGNRSLSEEFMMGRYGTIGTLSATRLTFASANAAFDEDLFNSIFNVKPSTLGAIIADAKIKFIGKAFSSNRQSWIPGAEQYILFGDPATQLALPDLEVKVELDDIALNPNKQLVVRQNIVGDNGFVLNTGKPRFLKATDFSTDQLSAAVIFANNFDDNQTNDLTRRQDNLTVWKGDFGNIRFDVPLGVTSGRGIVRLFASDGKHTAIGAAEFWTNHAIFYDVREEFDTEKANVLHLYVQIVDDTEPAGIKSIDVDWSDTVEYKTRTIPMVPRPRFSEPVIDGGRWWHLNVPIPLPQAGKSILYRIRATDTGDQVVFYPSEAEQRVVKIPVTPNLAIAPNPPNATSIRYRRLRGSNEPVLMAELINDGGSDVSVEVEVWFTEGNPDRNVDNQIDPEANVVGKVVVRPSDWEPGDSTLQKVTVVLALDEPLSRGIHEIHVFADPELPSHKHGDRIVGALDEGGRSADNKGSLSIDVNEYTLLSESELTCISLDNVFEVVFPAGSLNPTTLSIGSLETPNSFQPDLQFVPIPLPASVLNTPIRQSAGASQAYEIRLPSTAGQLARPVTARVRFQSDYLQNQLGSQSSDEKNQDDAMVDLAIYAWKEQLRAWRRVPSEVRYSENGNLLQDRFLTPAQSKNGDHLELLVSQIEVHPHDTPIGKWVILFIDSESYIVLLRQSDNTDIIRSHTLGKLDRVFLDRELRLEIKISRMDANGNRKRFEFGDVLAFETELDRFDSVVVSDTRNTNRGSGTAEVNLAIEPEDDFGTGDWLIFFRDNRTFEIHDSGNIREGGLNEDVVLGSVDEPLFISDPGIKVLVSPGNEPFVFGDKFKFSSRTVSVVSAEVSDLNPFALMASSDIRAPRLQLWVNGEFLVPDSFISPRPKISMLLEDSNGIDMDAFRFVVSKNGGPFKEISEFTITNKEQATKVPIFYGPVLSVGHYLFRIWARDLNGNRLDYDGGYKEFMLFVDKSPDIEPPEIEIRLNQEILTDGMILHQQPKFEVRLSDFYGLDSSSIQFLFAGSDEQLALLPNEAYDLQFDDAQPKHATIVYAPNLDNDEYQMQIFASDTSKNTHEGEILRFQLDEAVEIEDVGNVPNPIRTNTFFTYNLAQTPDQVTIKIYTIAGKLVRTIAESSAKRGYNETYWDGRDEDGVRLANNTYFYKVTVEAENRQIERVGRLAILR